MGYGCLQTTFCVFNGLISVLAAACVGVGAWALADPSSFSEEIKKMLTELKIEDFTDQDILNAAILLVVVGCIIMVLAGIGCCGAMKNSKCLLGVFFFAMVIICVIVIAIIILVQVYPKKFRDELTEKFKKYIADQSVGKEEIENFQKTFKCCGITGPDDYSGNPPASCGTYKMGCVDAFMKNVSSIQSPVFIVTIITLILLVLATAISGYLYCRGDGQGV